MGGTKSEGNMDVNPKAEYNIYVDAEAADIVFNCGAPVKHLGGNSCDYCGTFVEPINLKNWFISSCKEK